MTARPIRRGLLAVTLLAGIATQAWAQGAYPSKTIRIVAPFAAGGAADTVARIIGPKLSTAMGQTVVVENRAGAGGAIGSAYVAGSPPDGYTLLMNLGPPHQTVQLFTKGVSYDPVKDFSAIAKVAVAPQAVAVPANSPIKSMADLVSQSQANPKGLSFGTSGAGTSQHLAGLLLATTHKARLTHVPYRGGSAALTDVLSGQVDLGILVLSNLLPHVQTGKLRILAVVESARSSGAPQIPTAAESGVPGFSVPDTWVGLLGPAGLPEPVVRRLGAELEKIMRDAEVVARMSQAGYDIRYAGPAEFSRQLADSAQLYKTITQQAGITPE
jgi:tripartite-type tricarboxylate transporter receptor subunit TctC